MGSSGGVGCRGRRASAHVPASYGPHAGGDGDGDVRRQDEQCARTAEHVDDTGRAAAGALGGCSCGCDEGAARGSEQNLPHRLELTEQGFYEIRGEANQAEVVVAANVDPAEADLTPMDPREITAAAVGAGAETEGGPSGVPLTPEAREKNQRLWWYLLIAGILLLGVDTLLSNRMAKA